VTARFAWSRSPAAQASSSPAKSSAAPSPELHPAIEKGIVESAARGYLAGFPVVDFKATVYDGSYHDVDSNEMSFKMAGRIAFRKAMETAKPCLLEPS